MYRTLQFWLILGVIFSPTLVHAQSRERLKISNIRIGLPNGPTGDSNRKGIFKTGQWAPIYADFECVKDTEEPIKLLAEVYDADEILTQGSVDLAPMVQGERRLANELGRFPYLKAPHNFSNFSLKLVGVQSGKIYAESSSRSSEGLTVGSYVVLSLGGNLSSFKLPSAEFPDGDPNNTKDLRNGWVCTSQILEVGLMPDHWIGYSAVDLLILNTGSQRAFWEELAAPQHEKRRKALLEWVRRGGRVIVGLGTNVDAVTNIPEIKEILPAAVPSGGKINVSKLEMTWQVNVRSRPNIQVRYPGNGEFPSVTLTPREDRTPRVLLTDFAANGPKEGRPAAIQGSYGLGRVSVFVFDLDRSPFVEFPELATFWENAFTTCGFQLPAMGESLQSYSRGYDELTGALQGNLDFFEGVPVVSFGWVALFILLYILLIGPIDYFFLKKVVRRLEWTWLTFPIIVISVSTAAYFTAYAIKGQDLRTNKIDVVDYDLQSGRVDGHTWFTLFSPRIQKYTISIEPSVSENENESAWAIGKSPEVALNSVLAWSSAAETRHSGGSGARLWEKKYDFESVTDPLNPNRELYANSLDNVPIQVWTTKSFSARWTANYRQQTPPIEAKLQSGRGTDAVLSGTIMNNLPIEEFSDIGLVWRGKVFQLRDLPRGIAKPVTISSAVGESDAATTKEFKTWLNEPARYSGAAPYLPKNVGAAGTRTFDSGTTSNPNFRLWPLLFHEVSNDTEIRSGKPLNVSLRDLDQSWRVASERYEQAILLLRVPTQEGKAEEMTTSALSPSRLWLGSRPSEMKTRPTLQGILRQETYIRVLIPVKTIR